MAEPRVTTGGAATGAHLLIMIVRSESALDRLLTGMLDVGITGATVVESKGMGAIIRQEMPIFAGLSSLLPQQTGSRMVIAVTNLPLVDALKMYVEEMPAIDRPLAIVVPITDVFGAKEAQEFTS